jgi:hypothetical protein
MNHINPIHTIPSYLSKIHPNIIHPPTSWSFLWSSSFWLSYQYPICIPSCTLVGEIYNCIAPTSVINFICGQKYVTSFHLMKRILDFFLVKLRKERYRCTESEFQNII